MDETGKLLAGEVEISNEESIYSFIPDEPWSKGTFIVQIEARLEDLAGNNLNRPFDRDMSISKPLDAKEVFKRIFQVN